MKRRPQAMPDVTRRDMGVLPCAERVRSYLREPGCCISREQALEDFEAVFSHLLGSGGEGGGNG